MKVKIRREQIYKYFAKYGIVEIPIEIHTRLPLVREIELFTESGEEECTCGPHKVYEDEPMDIPAARRVTKDIRTGLPDDPDGEKPYRFNFPKLRQLAKDIREATRRERRFNWLDFDTDKFLEDCERAHQIFEAEERRQREAESGSLWGILAQEMGYRVYTSAWRAGDGSRHYRVRIDMDRHGRLGHLLLVDAPHLRPAGRLAHRT